MTALDWSQCPAVESIPAKVGEASDARAPVKPYHSDSRSGS
jgi:hypothetical protein